MGAMEYETLLRRAFGFANDGRILDRWGDPAGIANTDEFSAGNLDTVKAGTAYAMEILTGAAIEHLSGKGTLSETEYARLKAFTGAMLNAPDLVTVGQLIENYRNTVENVYFAAKNGYLSLK